MPLDVRLMSGKPLGGCSNFEGHGAELRERVACELQISPQRVSLLAGSREITDEETLSDSIDTVTAMVAEGQELAQWCEEKMPEYSFTEVSGVGVPDGSEEIDAKLLGRVFMLALKRFLNRTQQRYVRSLKELGVAFDPVRPFLFSVGEASPFYEAWARRKLENPEDVSKWEALHRQAQADVKRGKRAIATFVALDERLVGPNSVRCFSRWEVHQEDGQEGHHRVYGLRQAYSGVEFDKILGMWIEAEGDLDWHASISILGAWTWYGMRESWMGLREPRYWEEQRDIRRECSTGEVAARFETFCDVIAAAQTGQAEAAWLKPHISHAVWAMMLGIHTETLLLAESCYPASKGKDEPCMMILGRALKAILRMSAHVEGLKEKVFEAILCMADHRNDALRIYGLDLLREHFPTEQKTAELLERQASADWPHMRPYVEAAHHACQAVSAADPLPASDVPHQLPSPRRLVNQKLLNNPIEITGERYNLRGDLKHVLFEDVDEVEPE
ncbi:unnamed protein product [Symbiodinium natans]|uniref:Uncharacterized protein n=1 Tax=Symbiodinium natans TaxID=878477 RepID=A0A812IPJ9_9DINO|nr:unnamed protein product [Symbiodinium natans]